MDLAGCGRETRNGRRELSGCLGTDRCTIGEIDGRTAGWNAVGKRADIRGAKIVLCGTTICFGNNWVGRGGNYRLLDRKIYVKTIK